MLADAYSPAGTGAGTAALEVDATDAAAADIGGVPKSATPATLTAIVIVRTKVGRNDIFTISMSFPSLREVLAGATRNDP